MKHFKKALAVLLSVFMLIGVAPAFTLPAKAADVWDGSWDGSGFSNNHITSAKGLAQFINNCGTGTSYSGQTVYLDVDIDLNSIDFGNISGGKNVYYSRDNYFQGTFDGQGHTIYNFQMHNSDHRIGLFRSATNATFKNVNFENVFIDDNNNNGKNGFAVVVGLGDGNITFENVHVKSGEVYGYNYVGGLIGEYSANNTLTFRNCSNAAKISADHDRAAGLVGHSKGSVIAENCSNSGAIYAGYSDAGGIAGWIEDDESSFTNCSNTGSVSTDSAAGGIFGYYGSKDQDKKMTIIGCTNTGRIESRKTSDGGVAGGIAGKIDTDYNRHEIKNCVNRGDVVAKVDAGGIVGCNAGYGYWENNVNYGDVTCNNDNAGGILGEIEDDSQEFRNCYNMGDVTGRNSVGGIFGYGNATTHTFYRCANSGTVTSTSDSAGGVYGYGGNTQPTIEECWNIGTIRAYNDAGGILGHTNHHSYIRRCFNAGSIETYNHNDNGAHGGIVGQTSDLSGSSNSNPNMTDCFNWGPVSGGRDDGGLIGKIRDGNTPYYITNSYNAGSVSGVRPFAIIAYGGNVGDNVYYKNDVGMGTLQGSGISDGDLKNSSGFSGNYCKNTWGVKIGGTTYYYPILTWYRDMFHFLLWFKDDPTGTNTYMDGNYNAGFYTPDPSRTGFTPSDWFNVDNSSQTIGRGAVVYLGNTAPTNQYVVTQEFSDVRSIHNETVHRLNWTRNQYYLDVNGWLDADSGAGGVGGYGTFDMYVNGNLVADDVDDFWQQIYYEDTYEIRDIKAASGKAYVGVTEGSLSGTMGTDAVNIRLRFKTQYTVTFVDANGNTSDTQTVLYGESATAPSVTEYLQKSGDAAVHYRFLGTWDTDFTNVTSNLTVTGNYETQQHSYGAYESVNSANHIRSCAACGFVENTMHRFTAQTVNNNAKKTAATCTEAAVYYYSCADCGAVEGNDAHTFTYGTANGHQYGAWTEEQAATCAAAGHVGYYYCSVCEKYFDAEYNVIADIELPINPDAHAYGAWTKLDDEKHQRVCANNPAHTETEDHTWNETGHTDATCIAYGTVSYECAVCGATKTETGDVYGAHAYGAWTKLDDEKHQRVCENNPAHTETEDHAWNETGHTDATCSAYGTVSYACAVCGATKTETGDVYGGHTFTAQRADEDYLAVSATCVAPARYYYSCAVCGLSENDAEHTFENGEPDTVNGHQLTHHNAKAPTCTAVGWEAYDECALCTYTTYVEIPAAGHHYAEPAAEDWIWTRSGDTFTATVTVSCEHNDDSRILTASVEMSEYVPATADADGYKLFTATATVGEGDNQQTFIAEKTLAFYYVTVAPGTGVAVSGAESGSYETGTVLTVSAAAVTGYDQSTPVLYVNGAEAENPAEITVNAPVAVTTSDLPLNTYTLTWVDQWGNVLATATGKYGYATIMPIDDPADVRIEDKVYTFDHWDNGKTAGQSINFSSAAQTPVITAIYTLTDQVAKYSVRFLNDDNYTVLSTAEYEYNEAVVVPGTPVSTNRTKELDYTFLGWSPEVAGTVTADATYVATYETEAHSRIYPVKWVYNDGSIHVIKEENLPYNTVFAAENIPADVIVQDDEVTHYTYSWSNRIGAALADHINYGTSEVNIYADYSIDRHVGEPSYEWVGSDAEGYTKCVGSFTCTLCGESFTVEDDDLDPYTHTGENCRDRTYTSYFASLSGSGANSYFENKTKKVYGEYGPHIYGNLTAEWNTENPDNVTCTGKKLCFYCDAYLSYPGTVTVDHTEDATCVSPELTYYHAVFDLGDGWTAEADSEGIETASIDPAAHRYGPLDEEASVRPVYDPETDTWSKATLVFHCNNVSDGSHDKVIENVDRADYTLFDENVGKVRSLPDYDWNPDAEVELDSGYGQPVTAAVGELLDEVNGFVLPGLEHFPDNLITYSDPSIDEQPQVDMYAEGFIEIVDIFFNADGTPKEELLNHYTVTFTLKDGSVTSYNKVKGAVVDVPAAPADVEGFAFLGWTLDGTTIALAANAASYTVTGEAAFTAKYADTPTSCTVTFLNADGTGLATVTLAYGAELTEAQIPAIPAKTPDAENHYTGAWDNEIVTTVTVDAIYKIVYTSEAHTGGTATCKEKARCTVCETYYGDYAAHVYGEWTEGQAATCAAAGWVGYYYCGVCEKYFDAEYNVIDDIVLPIAPDAHAYGAWTKLDDEKHQRVCENNPAHTETEDHAWNETGHTDATCNAYGTVSYECAVCGAAKTETGDVYGAHVYGEWTEGQAATCAAAGWLGHYECGVCHKYFDAEYAEIADIVLPIAPDAHAYGAWTKLDDEKHQRVCANDPAHVETEDHTWNETGHTDATCNAYGTVSYACSVCGAAKTETGDVYGAHVYGAWTEGQAATCAAAGWLGHYECGVCHKYFDAEYAEIADIVLPIAPDAHAYGAWTKLDDEKHQRVCANDPAHVETEDHAWNQTGSSDATCLVPGTISYACAVCGAEKTETGALGEHAYGEWIEEVPAKCEENGVKGHYHCAVCGKDFDAAHAEIEDLTLPATGHAFGDWTVTVEPTCTEAGEETRTCSLCPATETRPAEALGHDYTAWTEVTPATCTAAGEETRGCSRCDLEETRTVAALGHSWGAWVTVTEPTVEANGLRRRECARCDAFEEQSVAYDGTANRQIQFVVSGSMHYVVHMGTYDYEIYSKTTPAIYWYDNVSLSFDVVTHYEWGADGIVVTVNGKELAANADGSYTIPGGTDYVKINCYTAPAAAESHSDVCAYCGKVHPNSFWGRLVAIFHMIFAFFKNLFKR